MLAVQPEPVVQDRELPVVGPIRGALDRPRGDRVPGRREPAPAGLLRVAEVWTIRAGRVTALAAVWKGKATLEKDGGGEGDRWSWRRNALPGPCSECGEDSEAQGGVTRSMARQPERRRTARLPIPSRFSGPGREEEPVRLLDLSREGARIEHVRPVSDWKLCSLTLPPALGGARLQGMLVWSLWSRVMGRKVGPKGARQIYHQSGLTFILLTPAQQDALAAALEILKAAQEAPPT